MASRASIVILSHRPELLGAAVASALAQTVPVHVMVQHDRDAWPGKLNQIVAASVKEWIIPLCDDDLLDPRYVERCLFFSQDADIVFTDRKGFGPGVVSWWKPWTWMRARPATGLRHQMFGPQVAAFIGTDAARVTLDPGTFAFGQPLPMTAMIRRSWWTQLGGYDDAIPHADTEFWFRSVKGGARVVYVPEPLFWYRYHSGQLSAQRPSMMEALRAFHRKHFADFGHAYPTAKPLSGTELQVDIISPDDRAEYARTHFRGAA